MKNITCKSLFLACTSVLFVFSAKSQFDMGGGPPPEKKYEEQGEIEKFSKTQKKYQNKIVFSSSSIDKNNEDPSTFKNEFALGDAIHYRMYWDETIEKKANNYVKKRQDQIFDAFYQDYTFGYFIDINGETKQIESAKINDENIILNSSTYGAYIFNPSSTKPYKGRLSVALRNAFLNLGDDFKPGNYDIKITVYVYPSAAVAEEGNKEDRIEFACKGEFKLKVTEEGINKYLPALCRNVKRPAGSLEDKELESEISKNFKSNFPNYTPKIVYLVSDGWTVFRNNFNQITRKAITATIIYKTESGETKWMDYAVDKQFDGVQYGAIKYKNYYRDKPVCPQCIDYFKKNN